MIYSRLKDVFEVKFMENNIDLPTHATPGVAKEHEVLVNESHKERPLVSSVPQSAPIASTTFNTTSGNGLIEDVSACIKRQILSKKLYISTKRNEKK